FQVGRPSSFILTPGYEDSVQIIFAPLRPEPFQAFLSLETDDPAQPQYLVPIRGEAIGPKIVVIPDTLHFGWVIVDSTKTLYLTIRNDGKADLLTANHRLEGPDAGDFHFVPPPNVPIPPQGSVMIPVSFRPRSLGRKTASLYIESTDFMNPSVSVVLIGNPTTTGVDDLPRNTGLTLELYPNPVSLSSHGRVALLSRRGGRISVHMTVVDALGRAVRELSKDVQGTDPVILDIAHAGLRAGVYYVRLATVSPEGVVSTVGRLVVSP
ncbi:MAG: hypothetical protein QHI48_02975, partial [Bacteroidota bacterium]|nr:hypothetical protein [Bacteroidota bacterium]